MFSPAGAVLSAMHVKLESTTASIAVDWHDDDYREQAAQQQYLLRLLLFLFMAAISQNDFVVIFTNG